jgi:alpha-L-rhamnosidase
MIKGELSTLGENLHNRPDGTNHHPFGACIGSWFYYALGGIRVDASSPGFKNIIISPEVVDDLEWVNCSYQSIMGPVVSNWEKNGDSLTMNVEIPPNATATVYVPAKSEKSIFEDGHSLNDSEGITFLKMENGRAVLNVLSGSYHFVSQY